MKQDGYPIKKNPQSTKRFVQTLDLKNDPELIRQYKYYHSKEGIWPEILQGIKECGVLEMEIYLLDNRLFMIVELDIADSWESVMERMGKQPRQQEWETFVAKFQQADNTASSEKKWQLMERIFRLYE